MCGLTSNTHRHLFREHGYSPVAGGGGGGVWPLGSVLNGWRHPSFLHTKGHLFSLSREPSHRTLLRCSEILWSLSQSPTGNQGHFRVLHTYHRKSFLFGGCARIWHDIRRHQSLEYAGLSAHRKRRTRIRKEEIKRTPAEAGVLPVPDWVSAPRHFS